jgi:hypothetical protein
LLSPKPLNYGGFGQPKIVPEPAKGAFANFSMSSAQKKPFNADLQFKASLLEVLGGTEQNARLYTMATPSAGPGAAYL